MADAIGPHADGIVAGDQRHEKRLVDRFAAKGDAHRITGTSAGRIEQHGDRGDMAYLDDFLRARMAGKGEGDEKWLKSAAAAKDIDYQIASTKELIKQCK